MLVPLDHETWQILRVLVRNDNKPLTGRELRVNMTRRTKDGTFLTNLCDKGLLRCTKHAVDPFKGEYQLMPLGEHAAEWGECELSPEIYREYTTAGGRTQANKKTTVRVNKNGDLVPIKPKKGKVKK